MNRPYVNVEAILEMFRRIDQENTNQTCATRDSLNWLTEYLAREHSTMNVNDWNGLLRIGALLLRAADPGIEVRGDV